MERETCRREEERRLSESFISLAGYVIFINYNDNRRGTRRISTASLFSLWIIPFLRFHQPFLHVVPAFYGRACSANMPSFSMKTFDHPVPRGRVRPSFIARDIVALTTTVSHCVGVFTCATADKCLAASIRTRKLRPIVKRAIKRRGSISTRSRTNESGSSYFYPAGG